MTSDHGVDGQPKCNWRYVEPTSESETAIQKKGLIVYNNTNLWINRLPAYTGCGW